MTAAATTISRENVAPMDAEPALRAWHSGSAAPADVLPILHRSASSAADHSNLGAVLRAAGDLPAAEAAYRRAIELDPLFAPAHHNLGNLLADLNRLDEAAASYQSALTANSTYAEAANALGVVRQRQGRLSDAESAFRNASQCAMRWAEPLVNLGVTLLGLERYAEAERLLRQAIVLDPSNAAQRIPDRRRERHARCPRPCTRRASLAKQSRRLPADAGQACRSGAGVPSCTRPASGLRVRAWQPAVRPQLP
ncbi:MAG: tetratricopeptide repeat protein [Rhodospirillales bacterium]|nr:tetratricopeptide repeat protein [Rhodospirillales bacterium]